MRNLKTSSLSSTKPEGVIPWISLDESKKLRPATFNSWDRSTMGKNLTTISVWAMASAQRITSTSTLGRLSTSCLPLRYHSHPSVRNVSSAEAVCKAHNAEKLRTDLLYAFNFQLILLLPWHTLIKINLKNRKWCILQNRLQTWTLATKSYSKLWIVDWVAAWRKN